MLSADSDAVTISFAISGPYHLPSLPVGVLPNVHSGTLAIDPVEVWVVGSPAESLQPSALAALRTRLIAIGTGRSEQRPEGVP